MWLARYLYPDEFRDTIYDVDVPKLVGMGIKIIYLDIDNTLIPFGTRRPSLKCEQWVLQIKAAGMTPLILSNNRYPNRVEEVAEVLDIPAVCWALKPLPWGLQQLRKQLQLPKVPEAIIGDQLFTDVILGKTQGLYTILVKPLRLDNKPTKAFQYELEQSVLRLVR